jgi:sulfonate transport system substrate-binding protein
MSDLRVIADEFQDGAHGYFSTNYMVLKDSAIRAIEDLKGKTVAVNGIGSGTDILMQAVLLKHGLVAKRDYTEVEASPFNMRAMLAEHKIDLGTLALPAVNDPEVQKIARPLFYAKDGLGASEFSFWAMHDAFLRANRAAVVDLLEDYVRMMRWYMDPANHAEAVAILARVMKMPPETFDSWIFTQRDWYRDHNAMVDVAALQRNIAAQKDLGFLKTDLDIAKNVDLAPLEEAVKRVP